VGLLDHESSIKQEFNKIKGFIWNNEMRRMMGKCYKVIKHLPGHKNVVGLPSPRGNQNCV
jgi:hypothetical protein